MLRTRLAPALGARALAVATAFGLSTAGAATAQIARAIPSEGAASVEAPIAARYRNGGFERWLFGSGYRDVWATPVAIPVLDLTASADGLAPVETGGYGQTVSLELAGGDGLEYAVRSIDKDPTKRMDPLLVGTVVADVAQDQIGQFLPTAALVVDPLLDATGVLHPRHRLVVLPDDPGLGAFREDFAGLIGMFTDRPQEGPDDTPGFAGSDRIVGTEKLFERLEEGACDRVDARAYLKARLMDVVIGDRDRHAGQWRWARFPDADGCPLWTPIPEDRDQAFVRNDGFMMTLYRMARPQQVAFGPEYPDIAGLTFNGWEVDRQVLAPLDGREWTAVAHEITSELTDDVIADAVRRLPDAHYTLVGPFLERSLRARRNGLVEQADAYFRLLSREADVTLTDRDERAVLEHLPSGDLRLTVRDIGAGEGARPTFDRTFRRGVTEEIRVYLKGGDDEVDVRGEHGSIEIRVIGGGGDDRFVNGSRAHAGDTHFYDDRGDNLVAGAVDFDERPYERPAADNQAHRHALDWGSLTRYFPVLSFETELGLSVGVRADRLRHGFRAPGLANQTLRASVASAGLAPLVEWRGRRGDAVLGADALLEARYSGREVLRFYGLGSRTVESTDPDFYHVVQRELTLAPALEWTWGRAAPDGSGGSGRPTFRLGAGPVVKVSHTPERENERRFISTMSPAPLGFGRFAQAGGRAWLEIDTRDRPAYPTTGLHVEGSAAYYPSVLDASDGFGHYEGTVSGYVTPTEGRRAPTLALRVGGVQTFGATPFHEAAFLGGRRDLRGSREQRWAGDAAIWANTEVRQPLARFSLLFPAEIGVHAVGDVGRVSYAADGADAGPWRTGFGGGVWLSVLERSHTFTVTVVQGAETVGVYAHAGFHF